jgi:hypothetical protein
MRLMSCTVVQSQKFAFAAVPRRCAATAAALALAGLLAGCASTGDDVLTTALAAPGKFNHFTCKEIEEKARATQAREQELQQLMARASQGPGGDIVGLIAYRSDYGKARSELKLLADAAAAKQCASSSTWSSQRSVF